MCTLVTLGVGGEGRIKCYRKNRPVVMVKGTGRNIVDWLFPVPHSCHPFLVLLATGTLHMP